MESSGAFTSVATREARMVLVYESTMTKAPRDHKRTRIEPPELLGKDSNQGTRGCVASMLQVSRIKSELLRQRLKVKRQEISS